MTWQKGRHQQAKTTLQQLRGGDSNTDVTEELAEIQRGIERQTAEQPTVREMFTTRSNWKVMAIMISMYFFMEFSGIDVISSYILLIFERSGAHISKVVTGTVYGTLKTVACLTSLFFIDSIGRRKLLVGSSSLGSVSLLLMSLFFYFDTHSTFSVEPYGWMLVVLLAVYLLTYNIGLGVVPYVLSSELYPIGFKFLGMTINQMAYATFGFLSFKIFELTGEIGKSVEVPFLIFGVCCAVCAVFALIVLKETKGKTLETIQQNLKTYKSGEIENHFERTPKPA